MIVTTDYFSNPTVRLSLTLNSSLFKDSAVGSVVTFTEGMGTWAAALVTNREI